MLSLDLDWIRAQFPALSQEIEGQPAVFFDGPGGTQVPQVTIDAMSHYLIESNANAHAVFATSQRTDKLIAGARVAIADFLGCEADEVIFGANMTTLTFALSRAIGRELQAGDEIVVTQLDHYANVSPWLALQEKGVIVRQVAIEVKDCTLNMDDLRAKINERTKVVAVGYASNAVGSINDLAEIVRLAHGVGAIVFVDAVHYAPHGLIDLKALDCDFLACSAYKFFAPHVGILYGKREHLVRLRPYKVQPAPNDAPSCWETGTQNHEGLAGVIATIDYLAQLGERVQPLDDCRRSKLSVAMKAIYQHEQVLCQQLIGGLLTFPEVTIYGITDSRSAWRTPTIALRVEGQTPYTTARLLGDRGIFTWQGNFYALGLTEALGIEASGGLLRIGLMHYNTSAEVDRFLDVLPEAIALSSLANTRN